MVMTSRRMNTSKRSASCTILAETMCQATWPMAMAVAMRISSRPRSSMTAMTRRPKSRTVLRCSMVSPSLRFFILSLAYHCYPLRLHALCHENMDRSVTMRAFLCFTLVSAALALTGPAWADDEAHSLDFSGLKRSYLLHLPAKAPAGPVPLVVVLHGGGGTAEGAVKMTGFDAEADASGFIAVYPNGTDKDRPMRVMLGKRGFLTWNAGSCCGYAQQKNIDDVGFIRAVVGDVEKQHAVDPKQVYATGISNGGMMSYRLACKASELFAAIGPVAG